MQHKKQLFNLFEEVAALNNDVWGNHKFTYNDKLEASFQIEEALEGGNSLEYLMRVVTPGANEDEYIGDDPKTIANLIVDAGYDDELSGGMTDVDRFDKHLDGLYYAIGSFHKLGLSMSQVVEGLQIVHNANKEKSGIKDANGKVTKPEDFINPEPLLQLILDRRTN